MPVEKLVVEFEIEFLDQLSIGSGDPSVRGADISLAYFNGLLPPSTFKGILRKACNRVVELVSKDWLPCPYVEPNQIRRMCKGGRDEYEWIRIFGVPGYHGEDYLTPMHISGLEVARPKASSQGFMESHDPIYTYTHVSIKQSSLTAREGALYTVEYLPKGTRARGRLIIYIRTGDEDLYGINASDLPAYLKLLLLGLIESTAVGIGRRSKPFRIRVLNKDSIISKLAELGITIDNTIAFLLNTLADGYDPYKPLSRG